MKTLLLSLVTLLSTAQFVDAGNNNPALYYWQGAALLPKIDRESALHLQNMASGKEPFDNAWFPSQNYKSTAKFLWKGSHSTADCDWGLDMEDGFSLMLPHLSKVRELHAVAVCLALDEFSKGHVNPGMEWLLNSHRIARHGGTGNTLITWLVYASMERNSLNVAALNCMSWPQPIREKYGKSLNDLLPLPPMLSDATSGELNANWIELAAAGAGLDPAEIGKEEIELGLEEVKSLHADLQDALMLRGGARGSSLKEIQKRISESSSPLVKTVMPGKHLFEMDLSLETRMQIVQALLKHGPMITEVDLSNLKHLLSDEPVELGVGDGVITLRCGKVELRSRTPKGQ